MRRFFMTCLALSIAFVSYAQKAVDFHFNPEIGKTLSFHTISKTDIDGAQSMIMNMDMQIDVLPSKKEDDNFTLENEIKAVKVDMNVGMMTLSYDSEEGGTDETSKMIGDQFSKIIDKKITSVISGKGKTIDLALPDDMAVQGLDPSTFSNMSPSLPEKAVVPGESWKSTIEMAENPVFSQMDMTSTYREETAEGYIIDVQGKMINAEGQESGTISGYYTLDKKTHFTKASKLQTKLEVEGTKISSDMEMTLAE